MSRRIASASVFLVFLLIGGAAARAEPSEEARRIALEVGQQVSIPAAGVAKYSEGVPGVVDIRLPEDATQFIVVGLKPGVTTLLLIYDDGRKSNYVFTVEALGDEVEEEENIRLDFYFVEVSDRGDYEVGLTWPTSIGFSSLEAQIDIPSGEISGSAGLSALPLPRLDLLQRSGWAKVVRQASIITTNGKKAQFQSGGEFHVAVQGSLAAELHKIPFGTTVTVLPRYDRDTGRLELQVGAEVSSLQENGSPVPSRNLSTVDTWVNVEMNQAVVLGGIRAESAGHRKEGLPVLSQIPVLGGLFGRHGARGESVQSVVFIVPSVVDVVGMDARRRIREAIEIYDDFSGDTAEVQLAPR